MVHRAEFGAAAVVAGSTEDASMLLEWHRAATEMLAATEQEMTVRLAAASPADR